MFRVGLTGGIASGKSTVARMMRDLGVAVIDSDVITHQLLTPGERVYDAVVSEFGPEILAPDRTIDRRALGSIVFTDPSRRQALNALVHPEVRKRQEAFLESVGEGDPDGIGVVDAALMIETGSYTEYDFVAVVWCTPAQQRERLRARGLSDEESEARMGAQMPLEEKLRYADYVIDNSGSLPETEGRVRGLLEVLRKRVTLK